MGGDFGHGGRECPRLGLLIASANELKQREPPMTKFMCLIAACAAFVPVAMATLSQAAQIVA